MPLRLYVTHHRGDFSINQQFVGHGLHNLGRVAKFSWASVTAYNTHLIEKTGGLLRIILVKGRAQTMTDFKAGIISGRQSDNIYTESSQVWGITGIMFNFTNIFRGRIKNLYTIFLTLVAIQVKILVLRKLWKKNLSKCNF